MRQHSQCFMFIPQACIFQSDDSAVIWILVRGLTWHRFFKEYGINRVITAEPDDVCNNNVTILPRDYLLF